MSRLFLFIEMNTSYLRIQMPCSMLGLVSRMARVSVRRVSGAAATSEPAVPEFDPAQLDAFVDSLGRDVTDNKNKGLSFAAMLRQSQFVQLGDFDGRVVTGKVVHRMHDDLYIDVGLKFNAVCKAPAVNGDNYILGSTVLVRLRDVELSERFLGANKDLTLLEADATLIRLLRGGKKRERVVPATSPEEAAAKKEGEASQ